jgi:ribosomal protein S18 acetylase RimI-like enzyme
VIVRKATPEDAAGIARIMGEIAAERVHSAITTAWTAAEQRSYIESLSAREAIHVAVDGTIIGVQTLEKGPFESMAHVAQIGTFLTAKARGRGIGRQLFEATRAFAVSHGYRKFAIQVRGSNAHAQAFYKSLGFLECGRWTAHVCVDGVFDDEVLMELPLE